MGWEPHHILTFVPVESNLYDSTGTNTEAPSRFPPICFVLSDKTSSIDAPETVAYPIFKLTEPDRVDTIVATISVGLQEV